MERKKWFVLGLFVVAVFLLSCTEKKEGDPLIGEWVGAAEDGQEARIKFMAGNLFVAGIGEDSLSGRYTLNSEVEPVELDLLIDDTPPIRTIIETLGENKIRIQTTEPGAARPVAFTAEAIVYSRDR